MIRRQERLCHKTSEADKAMCKRPGPIIMESCAKNDLFSGDSMVDLSPGSIIACNVKGQSGCDGGSTDRAWNFLRKYG